MMQNSVLATAYNVIAIPAAVGAFVSFHTLTLVQKARLRQFLPAGPFGLVPRRCGSRLFARELPGNVLELRTRRIGSPPAFLLFRARTRMSVGRSNVTVSKGCQRDNGKYFRSDILCSSVYSRALSERCKSTTCREGLHSAGLELQLLICPTTDWVYIQGYPVLKSRR